MRGVFFLLIFRAHFFLRSSPGSLTPDDIVICVHSCEESVRITKRQLRSIIKEEKAAVLSEGLSQEENLDNAITAYVNDLADQRGVDRLELKADVLNFVDGWFEYEEEVRSPRGRRQPRHLQ